MGDLLAWEFALVMVAVFAGAVVQGTIGFGFALVSTSAIGLVEPDAIPGMLLILSFPINVFVGVRERSDMDRGALRDVIVGLLLGTPAGVLVLVAVPSDQLTVVFGAAIVIAAMLSVPRPAREPSGPVRVAGGAVSGLITTVASTGGPAIALLFQRRPGPQLRATLAAAFFVSGTLSTIGVAVSGRLGWLQTRLALLAFPALLVGLVSSGAVARRVDARWLRPAVLVFAGGSGLAAVVRGLL